MLLSISMIGLGQNKTEIKALRTSTESDLKNDILPFWMDNTVDPDGGFYGMVYDKGRQRPEADKGAILNARILWTFSHAYRSGRSGGR